MITAGKSHPIVYEMRITASELDITIKGLKAIKDPSKYDKKLLEEYEILSKIRSVRACRKYGYMDESRLNWQ